MAENQTIAKKSSIVEIEKVNKNTIQLTFPWEVVIDGERVTHGRRIDTVSTNHTPESFAKEVVESGKRMMDYSKPEILSEIYEAAISAFRKL